MASIGRGDSRSRRAVVKQPRDSGGLQVDITVIKAINLPDLKNKLGKDRCFYITITDGTRTKKCRAIHARSQSVVWNQKLDGFTDSSDIKLSLYAEHQMHKDKLIGCVNIKAESKIEVLYPLASEAAPDLAVVLKMDMPELVEATSNALGDVEEALAGLHVLDEWKGTIDNVLWVMDIVGDLAQIHPYAQLVWVTLSSVPKLLIAEFEHDENVRTLVKAMRSTFDLIQAEALLKKIKPNSNQALILKVMLRHMEICSDVIKRYAEDKDFAKRLMKNITGGTTWEIQDLCETLGKLRQDLLDNTVISTQIAVERIQRSMDILPKQLADMDIDMKMNELPYKSGWRSLSNIDKNGCLPGTRTDFLDYITRWVDDPSSKTGLALLGQAGTGKSTIAHEIALRFQLEDRLGSYFSFLRNQKSRHEDYHLFTTLIHDLAKRYPPFKAAVGVLIKDDISLQTTNNFNLLFNTLLLGPLRELSMNGPILIIIDALDESANPTGRTGLAAFLSRFIGRLPTNFRVLITSRLDGDIRDWFANAEGNPFEVLQMNDSKLAKTEDDIRFYFKDPHNLTLVLFQEYGDELVQKSEGLFQWAAVACAHINEPPPGWTQDDCLRGLLVRQHADKKYARPLNRPLYELYDTVLAAHFNTEIACDRFRSVMGHLLAAVVPFSVSLLTILRQSIPSADQDHEGAVLAIVKHLGSFLSNVTSENHDLPIIPLHTSFRDYLTEVVKRDGSFFVDLEKSHNDLAYACLSVMLKELKFNICGLESSYIPNSKVPNLKSRIERHIRPALFYACRFWDDHLEHLSVHEIIFFQLQKFFEEGFLFWLEVLSLTDTVPLAVQAFTVLKHWMKACMDTNTVGDKWNQLNTLVTDAYQFVRYFATPIAVSAAHIYISALPFTPTSSKVYQIYSRAFSNTVAFVCGQQSHWPALEMSINLRSMALSVAFSPDGRYIATALANSTIRIWNATTGKMEGEPLMCHNADFLSATFSPDGKWIASGSTDNTVCVWNASTCKLERGPFTAHTSSVNSVAFSRDGKWIISGSRDSTIILWNAFTGQIEQGPYTGHTKNVTSVAISPDGKKIVSGSEDKDIRIWNVLTGKLEHGPFSGHIDCVSSVAFSPDGQKIVSGSDDKTILLWNALTGAIEQGPMIGHHLPVASVAFSPDGKRIISGSGDQTVRIWNVNTGEIDQILYGHTGSVCSVAFSPDGQRIVSGSQDTTLCIWNSSATDFLSIEKSLDRNPTSRFEENSMSVEYTATVRSIAFSPDGNWIVSGSDDHTVCLWHASATQLTTTIARKENNGIYLAVFSPDGKWIAYGSHKPICLWNASTGELKGGLHGKQPIVLKSNLSFLGHTGRVTSVAFVPDGKKIVSGSEDKTIRLWNASTGELLGEPFMHPNGVSCVAVSPDGMWIVSGSLDSIIRLWNASTGELKRELQGHEEDITSVAFSPNGMWIVSGSFDCEVLLWDASTGIMKRGRPLQGWHTSWVMSVAFSPDGGKIISASDDETIRVWDAFSGELEYILPCGHTQLITSVSFSPDGTQILSSGLDRAVRVMPAQPITATPSFEICFNDLSVINRDGWIREDDGKLLLWIPSLHRPGLYRPNVPILIISNNQTRLDTSKFVHGSEWAACYTGI